MSRCLRLLILNRDKRNDTASKPAMASQESLELNDMGIPVFPPGRRFCQRDLHVSDPRTRKKREDGDQARQRDLVAQLMRFQKFRLRKLLDPYLGFHSEELSTRREGDSVNNVIEEKESCRRHPSTGRACRLRRQQQACSNREKDRLRNVGESASATAKYEPEGRDSNSRLSTWVIFAGRNQPAYVLPIPHLDWHIRTSLRRAQSQQSCSVDDRLEWTY